MLQLSYLQTILGAFTSLDIAGLRLHLNDEYSYQETTRLIFLSKLSAVFDSFINSGDTSLLAYEGACEGKSCNNCGVKGYRFVGNHSGNYIDLLFVMIDNDIRDIFYCEQFQTNTVLEGLKDKKYIYIQPDDCVTFNKTPFYWEKVFSAVNAYYELIADPPKRLDFIIASEWLEKHRALNKQIGNYDIMHPTMKWSLFSKLYADVYEYMSYISHHYTQIMQACNDFVKADSDEMLIDSIMKYKTLFQEAPFDFKYHFVKEGDSYVPETDNSFILAGEQFLHTLMFVDLYQQHEQSLLAKYNTYTREEFNNANQYSGDSDIFSLPFHLAKRKELEAAGINLPFYLIKDLQN